MLYGLRLLDHNIIVYKSHHSPRYFYSFGRQVNLLSLKVNKCDTDNTGELLSVAAQSQE